MAYCYQVFLANTTVSAAATLCIIRPSAAVGFRVRRIAVSQNDSETSTQIRLQYGRKASAFGTYTSATPQKLDEKDASSAFSGATDGSAGTVGVNGTSEGAGTFTGIEEGFNNLTGFERVFAPGEEPTFRAGSAEGFVLRFPAAPGTTAGWSWTVVYEEI